MIRPSLTFWSHVLALVIALVLLFSAGMVLRPIETQWLFNVVAFGTPDYPDAVPESARPYIIFVYRVLGAVMIGWMLALLAIVRGPFTRGEPWAWRAIAVSVGGWFVIDTTASLLTGYPGNALLNLAFGLGFGVPLTATRAVGRSGGPGAQL